MIWIWFNNKSVSSLSPPLPPLPPPWIRFYLSSDKRYPVIVIILFYSHSSHSKYDGFFLFFYFSYFKKSYLIFKKGNYYLFLFSVISRPQAKQKKIYNISQIEHLHYFITYLLDYSLFSSLFLSLIWRIRENQISKSIGIYYLLIHITSHHIT